METMTPMDKVCAIITDEKALKQSVHYDEPADTIKGFEDLGKSHRSPFVANYASAFMFEYEYRAVATGLMFNNSEKTNCEQDLDIFLLQFSTYASQESPQVIIDTEMVLKEHDYSRVAANSKRGPHSTQR
ncbi:unnamed protein product [Merluccius merluccius]